MITRFKNGNINVKFEKQDIQDIKSGRFSDIEILSFELENVDTYFFGEQFCLSNYAMGILLYSYYADRLFLLNFADIDEILMNGKTLKLYARRPDKEERERIEKGGF